MACKAYGFAIGQTAHSVGLMDQKLGKILTEVSDLQSAFSRTSFNGRSVATSRSVQCRILARNSVLDTVSSNFFLRRVSRMPASTGIGDVGETAVSAGDLLTSDAFCAVLFGCRDDDFEFENLEGLESNPMFTCENCKVRNLSWLMEDLTEDACSFLSSLYSLLWIQRRQSTLPN